MIDVWPQRWTYRFLHDPGRVLHTMVVHGLRPDDPLRFATSSGAARPLSNLGQSGTIVLTGSGPEIGRSIVVVDPKLDRPFLLYRDLGSGWYRWRTDHG